MADAITIKALQDAILDADSLEKFINGSDDETVLTRLSAEYPTIRKAIKELFESGGIAERFKTFAELQDSDLADGSYALVADDIYENNGIYIKEGGEWRLTSLSASDKSKTSIKLDLSKYPQTRTAPTFLGSGKWALGTKNYCYKVPVTSGEVYHISLPDIDHFQSYHAAAYVTFAKSDMYELTNAYPNSFPTESMQSNADPLQTPYEVLIPKGVVTVTVPDGFDCMLITASSAAEQFNIEAYKASFSVDFLKYMQKQSEVVDRISSALVKPTRIEDYFKTLDVRAASYRPLVVEEKETTTKNSYEIRLQEGDELSFDYVEFDGNIMWQWQVEESSGYSYPELSGQVNSGEVKSHTFTAYAAVTVRLTGCVRESIRVNGAAVSDVNLTYLGLWEGYQRALETSAGAYSYAWRARPVQLKKGDVVKISAMPFSAIAVLVYRDDIKDYVSYKGIPESARNNISREYSFVAEKDCRVLLGWGETASVDIVGSLSELGSSTIGSVSSGTGDDIERLKIITNLDYIPDFIEVPSKGSSVFATSMNFILKTEYIEGVDHIGISRNSGETWNYIENILGDIVDYHFFSDGTILLASPTKVYWTDDYQTLNESTVLDINGEPFYKPLERHFFQLKTSDKITKIDGKEIYVWGEYVLGYQCYIWYTTDFGRTIKTAAKIGTTMIDGKARAFKHIHRINYRTKDQTFYITTGDHDGNGIAGGECMILKAWYDFDTDVWTWKYLNSGDIYKFGSIFFDDNYAYLIADYTKPELKDKLGLYRVAVENLGDINKYELLYKPNVAEFNPRLAFSRYFEDPMGNKVILPDYMGHGWIFVARNGFDFKPVQLSVPSLFLAYIVGPNYNGDTYIVGFTEPPSVMTENNGARIKLNRGTWNLTEILRKAGIENFMRGHRVFENGGTICEQP